MREILSNMDFLHFIMRVLAFRVDFYIEKFEGLIFMIESLWVQLSKMLPIFGQPWSFGCVSLGHNYFALPDFVTSCHFHFFLAYFLYIC